MFTQAAAKTLVDYKAWADGLTLEAVAALPAAEVHRERLTLFRSIIGTLNHSYVVDLIWRAHLLGEDHGFTSRREILHPEIGALRQAQTACNDWLADWCALQTDATLASPVEFKFVSGDRACMTRGAILFHMVNHATYHRGWVSDLFFQIPAKPPTTDFSVYPYALSEIGGPP